MCRDDEKIAIIVDSGCDLGCELADKYNIKVLPLKVMYGMETFNDGIDIDPMMIYERFPNEIPKTSTPNTAEVMDLVEQIKDESYNKIIAICISSGLSGTYNTVKNVLEQDEDIDGEAIDSKNISIGAGLLAVLAAKLIEEGHSFEDIVNTLNRKIFDSRVFFYMDTLEYLKIGGRIGGVKGFVGKALDLRPIISCNESGTYYTETMIRGNKKSLTKLIKSVVKSDKGGRKLIAVMHGNAPSKVPEVKAMLEESISNYDIVSDKQITATMAVHTGPGLVGIGILNMD